MSAERYVGGCVATMTVINTLFNVFRSRPSLSMKPEILEQIKDGWVKNCLCDSIVMTLMIMMTVPKCNKSLSNSERTA